MSGFRATTRRQTFARMSAAQHDGSSSESSSVAGSRLRAAGTSHSTRGDVFRVDSESGPLRQHAATLSSDNSDDDDSAGLRKPAKRAFTVDASEAQTFCPPPAPLAAKRKARVRINAPKRANKNPPLAKQQQQQQQQRKRRRMSTAELLAERGAARAQARSALDALRTDQVAPQVLPSGAAPIRNYNDTPRRAARADAERDIVIDGDGFDSLRYDSAREFQDANRPPWAAPLGDKQLAQLMTWETLEVMSELEQRTKDWYTLALMVAGLVQVKAEAFVVFRPSTSSRAATQPTRRSVLGGYPLPYTAPVREPEGVGSVPPPATEAADERALDEIDRSTQVADNAGTDSFDEETLVPTTPGFAGQSLGGGRTTVSRARFPQFRRQQAAPQQPVMPFYVRGYVPESASTPAGRNQIASAVPWTSRSLATGVFYLAPEYTAARDTAHMLILSRADQLAGVELGEFVREAGSATVQHLVRVQFARLIALMYNVAKHNANRSSKLMHDMANYTVGAEKVVGWFVNRIDYEPRSRTFSDTGTRYARDRQRLGSMTGPVGAFAQARSDDRTQIYGTKPVYPLDPLLYTPGTLLSPLTNN